MFTLEISPRSKGTLSALRKGGKVPAVFYGRHEASTPIEVPSRVFEKVFKSAGESSIIELVGVGDKKQALINDIDVDPVTGEISIFNFEIDVFNFLLCSKLKIYFFSLRLGSGDFGVKFLLFPFSLANKVILTMNEPGGLLVKLVEPPIMHPGQCAYG